jgi:DNA-binding Lrp family transcriptional regulator
MATAYVLITTNQGSETEMLQSVKQLEGVDEAYSVYGVYDIVAKITVDTVEQLKGVVRSRIRRLPAIRSTLTMIVIE